MSVRVKILVVFGTRPEAIKMSPVVRALRTRARRIDVRVCVTAQHRQMLDGVLDVFGLVPEYDLDLMRPSQTLHGLTASVLEGLAPVLDAWRPDRVLVHGDTTTTLATSLAAFYSRVPVAHVEAGLRTGDYSAPWPEEMNRVLTGRLADVHFAPTSRARANLIREGVATQDVVVCGNTVIDALFATRDRLRADTALTKALDAGLGLPRHQPLLLVTCHRRENFGDNLASICRGLRRILREHPRVSMVWPLHLNPQVRVPVARILGDGAEFQGRLRLVEPLDYLAFTHLMTEATLILTDSGGIQEEAAALGKPTLILRETTERPEAVEAGTAVIVGADEHMIAAMAARLLRDEAVYAGMSRPSTAFGDGHAAVAITRELLRRHGVAPRTPDRAAATPKAAFSEGAGHASP